MKLSAGNQSIGVRYQDRGFNQIISQLRQERVVTQATMIAFTGLPTAQLVPAARDLATKLGKTLYRVDLKAVVSKYIGETEKNLGLLFQRAEVANWILFFDEADALFGKPADVKDAHDRFGNLPSDYILELLASHRVLVLALFKSRSEAERKRKGLRQLLVKFP